MKDNLKRIQNSDTKIKYKDIGIFIPDEYETPLFEKQNGPDFKKLIDDEFNIGRSCLQCSGCHGCR